jgi:hypothetical protein
MEFNYQNKLYIRTVPIEIYKETLIYLAPNDLIATCATDHYASKISQEDSFWLLYIKKNYEPNWWGHNCWNDMKNALKYESWKFLFIEYIYYCIYIKVAVNDKDMITVALHQSDKIISLYKRVVHNSAGKIESSFDSFLDEILNLKYILSPKIFLTFMKVNTMIFATVIIDGENIKYVFNITHTVSMIPVSYYGHLRTYLPQLSIFDLLTGSCVGFAKIEDTH